MTNWSVSGESIKKGNIFCKINCIWITEWILYKCVSVNKVKSFDGKIVQSASVCYGKL